MKKSFFSETEAVISTIKFDFNDRYVLKAEMEAHKLRAQAFCSIMNSIGNAVGNAFAGISSWVRSKAENNRVMGQLYSMDDRALADIGLTRGDIEGVLKGTLTSEPLQPVAENIEFMKKSTTQRTVAPKQDDTRIAA